MIQPPGLVARHVWAVGSAGAAGDDEPAPPEPHLVVRCHRRLRGPYTGGGSLLYAVTPELLELCPESVERRTTEIVALAPGLAPLVSLPPQTLTNQANYQERTRFYPASRTLRLSHGVTELLTDWARARHPAGAVVAFRELDEADPTDRELVSVLLRRCDPAVLTVLVDAAPADDVLGQALEAHARRTARPLTAVQQAAPGADPAQQFIDSDGTSREPALRDAYAALPAQERARRHTARAELLAARDEPRLDLGAIPYHLEHGTDPAGAGVAAFTSAVNQCFALGYYEAAMELAHRGRRIGASANPSMAYWGFTNKIVACLSYLRQGEGADAYIAEMRQGSIDPEVHMNCGYMTAMLYTRYTPKDDRDEDVALASANTAIVIADHHPDPDRRAISAAFMRNARALVELHRGNLDGATALVLEAIDITDRNFGPDQHQLHRSVLVYNRAQIHMARKNHTAALADYDEVIRRDPEYGDYYFERATVHRASGSPEKALDDYASAIRLSPPFHEAYFNRADLLRELGDDDAALRDLDYALELEPDHVDSRVNRADLLLALGQPERAYADIEHGLRLEPDNARLLCARGLLFADAGRHAEAYASYTDALTADPRFTAAWANRAVLAYTEGRLAEAVDDLDHAIRLGDDATLRANRAIALQDLGEHRRALADLEAALGTPGASAAPGAPLTDLLPDPVAGPDPDLLYRRGVSRFELGDREGALADWKAHLAAYGGDEPSPYAEQIRLRTEDGLLAARGAAPGSAP